jgi:hypothetical protein
LEAREKSGKDHPDPDPDPYLHVCISRILILILIPFSQAWGLFSLKAENIFPWVSRVMMAASCV